MAVRIDCKLPNHEGEYVEFRENPWPFKDRRAVMESSSDVAALTVILGYIVGSGLKDVNGRAVDLTHKPPETDGDGKPIARDPLAALDDLDDAVVSWLIGAWFEARNKRSEVPKAG